MNRNLPYGKLGEAFGNLQAAWSHSFREFRRQMIGARLYRIIISLIFIFALYKGLTAYLGHLNPHLDQPPDVDPKYLKRKIKQIEELESIKQSVSNELRDLEDKRNRIQDDITLHQGTLTTLQKTEKDFQSELKSLKRQILMVKSRLVEVEKPQLPAPARLLPGDKDNINIDPPAHYEQCQMHTCFDYSRCSLTSQFPIFVYNEFDDAPFDVSAYVSQVYRKVILSSPYIIDDPKSACLYIVILGETSLMNPESSWKQDPNTYELENWLNSLPYWHGDGRNHILIYLTKQTTTDNPLLNVNTGRAMVAQSNFATTQYRPNFDFVLPTFTTLKITSSSKFYDENGAEEDDPLDEKNNMDWDYTDVPYQLPAIREYILSFQGEWQKSFESQYNGLDNSHMDSFHKVLLDNFNFLKEMNDGNRYLLETSCKEDRVVTTGFLSEWSLCNTFPLRSRLLAKSTFSLVLPPENFNKITTSSIFITRLAESLRSGAIPVIVGTYGQLPFSEFINWGTAALIIPQSRFTELPHLLVNMPHAEILAYRKQGWFLYNTYFSTCHTIFEALLAAIRTRLQIPPLPVTDVHGNTIKHHSYKVENHSVSPGDAQSEFGIPPTEDRTDSLTFTRNFTSVTSKVQYSWNHAPGPFNLYPFSPNDELLPTDAQFVGSSSGFQNIGGGEGGTGKIYQESLGGNYPAEQFTVVMLTYEREEVLLQAVERLMGLPHLNKVVVVFND